MANINDSINFKNKEFKILINIKFQTTAEVTERTVKIAEAFGLGIDETMHFNIYENFPLGFNKDDIIYITGDSGSGKSLMIKEIKNHLGGKEGLNDIYSDINELNINPEETLIEGIGKDLNEAVKILSSVGLNDAFLFLRKYKQLSDGQKFRYKLAKLININTDFWIFDEFCATLDREMAKIISFNLQKLARKLGKCVIIATTHTDLKEDLNPSIYIYKKYNNEIKTEYNDNTPSKSCSILKNIKFEKCTKLEYEELSKFHYKSHILGGVKNYYCLRFQEKIIAVLVISMPHLHLKGRNKYFSGKYTATTKENFQEVNKLFESISRIIVHPKYRSIGLAYYLIKEYFKICKSKYVETIAVMPKYNPFFEKAGMTNVEYDKYDKKLSERRRRLENLGFNLDLLKSKSYTLSIYKKLEEIEKQEMVNICNEQLAEYNGAKNEKKSFSNDIELISFCHKLFSYDLNYLIWENPNYKEQKFVKMW